MVNLGGLHRQDVVVVQLVELHGGLDVALFGLLFVFVCVHTKEEGDDSSQAVVHNSWRKSQTHHMHIKAQLAVTVKPILFGERYQESPPFVASWNFLFA